MGMTRARALVLGDWLWRMNQSKALLPFLGNDDSELHVLWTLEAWLDQVMVFEFHGAVQHGEGMSQPGYDILVKTAREEVIADHIRTN